MREQNKTWLIPIVTGYAISMSNKNFCQSWIIHIIIDCSCGHSVYIRTVSSQLLLCIGTFVFFLAGLEIKCTVHVALQKWPINQFKLDQQSRQQALLELTVVIHILSQVVFELINPFENFPLFHFGKIRIKRVVTSHSADKLKSYLF